MPAAVHASPESCFLKPCPISPITVEVSDDDDDDYSCNGGCNNNNNISSTAKKLLEQNVTGEAKSSDQEVAQELLQYDRLRKFLMQKLLVRSS